MMVRLPDRIEEKGPPATVWETKKVYKFLADDACGAPAVTSFTRDGAIHHRCAAHNGTDRPNKFRDGPSTDPRSIGGSTRRYAI